MGLKNPTEIMVVSRFEPRMTGSVVQILAIDKLVQAADGACVGAI